MAQFISDHWNNLLLIGSIILNMLGVSGVVPPARIPKGFAKLEDDQKSRYD